MTENVLTLPDIRPWKSFNLWPELTFADIHINHVFE